MASDRNDWALYLFGEASSFRKTGSHPSGSCFSGETVTWFRDQAQSAMASGWMDRALYLLVKHDLPGKPVSTFPDHALGCSAHAGKRVTDAATVVAIRSRSSLAALLRCCQCPKKSPSFAEE
jgi:hypothetical protein